MARELCREIVRNITGKDVTEAEIVRLEKIVSRRAKRMVSRNRLMSPNDALQAAAEDAVQRVNAKATARKRAVLLNEGKRLFAVARIQAGWGKQLGLGLRSMVIGTQRGVEGARISAASQQDSLRGELVGGFQAALTKLGKDDYRLFLADIPEVENDIARTLWLLSRDTPDTAALAKVSPAARRIGQVVHDFQELARGLANKEGADIGRYAGYVFRASHDPVLIAANQADWMRSAKETFDLDRMLEEMDSFKDTQAMLDSLYLTLASGLHLRHGKPLDYDPAATVNVANQLGKEKVIHFKNADAFMRLQQAHTDTAACVSPSFSAWSTPPESTGMMQILGTNPGAFLNSMENQLAKSLREQGANAEEVKRFQTDVEAAKNRLREVDGSLDVPGHAPLAKFSEGIRALQAMASLGQSVVSSVSDLGLFIVSARHNGVNVFQAAGAAVGSLFKGRSRPEQIELASALGVVFDSLSGKMASRFSIDDGGRGAIAALQQQFFKLNLQTWWTDQLRFGAAEMLSHNLASHAGKSFDALDPRLAKTLSLYGVDAPAWNIARKSVAKAEDGRAFLSPADIADEKVSRALRAYFTDQNGYILLSPDAETRYLTKFGTQKGTPAGEAFRFAMQFKSFSVAFTQKMIGRELLSHIDPNIRGTGVYAKAMGNGAAMVGFSQLLVMSTIMGYLAMSMKDIIKGKEPRDPADPRTALAAMQQGGGLGIMGDFFFGSQNRMGGGLIASIAGPTAGDVESIANIFFKGRDAALDPEKQAEVGDDLYRLTVSNVPGNNLFYVRPVLDYLFMWNWQETLNPGAMQRMESKAAKQGQEFFISPAQRVAEQQASK